MAKPIDSNLHRLNCATTDRCHRWLGGIVLIPPRDPTRARVPLALWTTDAGELIDLAIVERNGSAVLRAMLDEALLLADAFEPPCEVEVQPRVMTAFFDMAFPKVFVGKAERLESVVSRCGDPTYLLEALPRRAA